MTRANRTCVDCGTASSGSRCHDCYVKHRYTGKGRTIQCSWCGITMRDRGHDACASCRHLDDHQPTAEDAYDGRIVRRGLISIFIPAPQRTRPTCPGLDCHECLGDLSTGLARRTDHGWRHALAAECAAARLERQGTAA